MESSDRTVTQASHAGKCCAIYLKLQLYDLATALLGIYATGMKICTASVQNSALFVDNTLLK
jgi:hypothetical protein